MKLAAVVQMSSAQAFDSIHQINKDDTYFSSMTHTSLPVADLWTVSKNLGKKVEDLVNFFENPAGLCSRPSCIVIGEESEVGVESLVGDLMAVVYTSRSSPVTYSESLNVSASAASDLRDGSLAAASVPIGDFSAQIVTLVSERNIPHIPFP